MGLLRRFSSKSTGMRRSTLLTIYKLYVRPILEFGCVLFSGCAAYKLRPLLLLERQALRLCLGLPKCAANNVLYLEARVIPLESRFKQLTVQTFLKIYDTPLSRSQSIFITSHDSFFRNRWRRYQWPQVVFVQYMIYDIQVSLQNLTPLRPHSFLKDNLYFDHIFPKDAKLLPLRILEGCLQDHLAQFPEHFVIATDATQRVEKAGVGIFSSQLNWSFALRLPDYTPIFLAEFLAITLAIRKLSPRQTKVIIITDAMSVCSNVTSPKQSPLLNIFTTLVPSYISEIRLVWVPGHTGIFLNESADSLATSSLDGPVLNVLPNFSFITAERFKRFLLLTCTKTSLLDLDDYRHLQFTWNTDKCLSRQCEVTIASLRCRTPSLNFYLNKSGFSLTNLCLVCNEPETIDHFLLSCRRFSSLRRMYLNSIFHKLRLPLTTPNLLSFGASQDGTSRHAVLSALHKFIEASGRLRC